MDNKHKNIFKNSDLLKCLAILFLSYVLITYGTSCAQPVSLTGGPRDTIPPVLNKEKSTPNFQTNFVKQAITLEFDEFVNVKDVFNQVVVSPPLETNLKIDSRAKKIFVEFAENEILKEKATYTIFFGDAIRDFNESNILENFRFVFATGDIIDHLQRKGRVFDAITNKAKEGVLVMLYEDTSDSIVFTDRPFYFAKTDKNGEFVLNNLKEGYFKIFALKDENLNYKYDSDSEWIGFLDSLVYTADSSNQLLEIQLFQEKPKLIVKEQELRKYGSAKFKFNQDPDSADADFIGYQPYFQHIELVDDSLLVYYDLKQDTSFKLAIRANDELYDTFNIRKNSRAEFLKKRNLPIPKSNLNRQKILKPGHSLELYFTAPISQVIDSLIIRKDSLNQQTSWSLDSLARKQVIININASPDKEVSLEFLKGAIVDIYGTSHDTFQIQYKYIGAEVLGSIKLSLTQLDSVTNYTVILKKLNQEFEKHQIWVNSDTTLHFMDLLPDTYEISIIEDKLPNGIWDSGNYFLKLQPERQIEQKLEALRENWTLELTLNISELFPE